MNVSKTTQWQQPVSRFLLGGLAGGLAGAIVSNIYNLIYTAITGNSYPELQIFTITMAGVVPGLIGGLVFYALTRNSRRPVTLFWIIGLAFAVLSIIPNFVAPPDPAPGFAAAASPMHLIVGLACLLIIPRLTENSSN